MGKKVTVALEIVRLRPGHTDAMARFFLRISNDPASRYFHPHPFTSTEAERVCCLKGRDLYHGLRVDADFVGYGMLRGWDEGYSVPSLGIFVASELRGTGVAKLLMLHLHVAAKLSGASEIRLKVYRENEIALKLYRALGYCFLDEVDQAQLTGTVAI
jgi:ribosomal protein S18 acetylase RimI-like enzyme